MPSNYRMMVISRAHTSFSARKFLATLAIPLAVGCSSSTSIRESQLEITPTESITSFSRASQSAITELSLSPDILANPPLLETAQSLSTTHSSVRALLLSEAWFLRGANDIEVPIATSLDRFLRAAHYAYDEIFTGNDCQAGDPQRCSDLFVAYNRAVREVGRLTNNGAHLPSPSESGYHLDQTGDGTHLRLAEWEVSLADTAAPSGTNTFGAAGAACQLLTANRGTTSTVVRRCAPITFTVSFDSRATDAKSRAHIAAYDTFGHKSLLLHSKEVNVPSDLSFTWISLLSPSPTQAITSSCLADVEPQLPTAILSMPTPSPESHWPLIAASLSADPHLQEHYNFCVLSTVANELGAPFGERIRDSLTALSPSMPQNAAVVVVAEGADGGASLRQLKSSLKADRASGSSAGLLLAGSLALPSLSGAQPGSAHEGTSSELTKQELSSLGDIKRLLKRVVDSDEGGLGRATRRSLPREPGVTISPVM